MFAILEDNVHRKHLPRTEKNNFPSAEENEKLYSITNRRKLSQKMDERINARSGQGVTQSVESWDWCDGAGAHRRSPPVTPGVTGGDRTNPNFPRTD